MSYRSCRMPFIIVLLCVRRQACPISGERRTANTIDILKIRQFEAFFRETIVAVVCRRVLPLRSIVQDHHSAALEERGPTFKSFASALRRMVGVKKKKINGRVPLRCDFP